MARLTDRLKALEVAKRVNYNMPLMMIVRDDLTESQKLEIHEAEIKGQKVILITRYKH